MFKRYQSLYEPVGETGASGTVTTPAATVQASPADNPFSGDTKETVDVKHTPETVVAPVVAPTTPEVKPTVVVPEVKTEVKPVVAQPVLTAEAIAAAVRAGQPPAIPTQPQISQEEFDKTFNVVRANDKDYAAILGYVPEKLEQVKALNDYTQKIVRQATSMADFRTQQLLQQLEQKLTGQIQPVLQQHEAAVGETVKNDFFKAHADLKDFEPLVMHIAEALRTSGKKMSKDDAFKFVADETRRLIPKGLVAAQPGTSPNNPGQPTITRSMTPSSGGGQSGASGSATAPVNDAKAIFG